MKQSKTNNKHEYTGEKYDLSFTPITEDNGQIMYRKVAWEQNICVGPGTYDKSHIDGILDAGANHPIFIYSENLNESHSMPRKLSPDNNKIKI